ncbi:MAG: methionyl-tRNA formyltransferase [Gemmatimonadaceae bacterium]
MRILFWGTSPFAIPCLRALVGEGFEVVGVVTQPDRPSGRSRSFEVPPPVKTAAIEAGVEPIFQPERPRGDVFTESIRALEPDISVVASYGHILSQETIALPRTGTVNVHASLLPLLRGASPIQAAILEGRAESGVTIMRMVPALDAGPTILKASTPILDDETYGELHLRLSELGALALIEALTLLELGRAEEEPQDERLATYAGKITRESTRITWTHSADTVARHIRAFDPVPGAHTTHHGADLKLFGATTTAAPHHAGPAEPGQVLAVSGNGLVVSCSAGAVQIADVQPAGKRRISAADWSRGRGVQIGDRFGA